VQAADIAALAVDIDAGCRSRRRKWLISARKDIMLIE